MSEKLFKIISKVMNVNYENITDESNPSTIPSWTSFNVYAVSLVAIPTGALYPLIFSPTKLSLLKYLSSNFMFGIICFKYTNPFGKSLDKEKEKETILRAKSERKIVKIFFVTL